MVRNSPVVPSTITPGTPDSTCQSRKAFSRPMSMLLPSSLKGVTVTVWLPRKSFVIILPLILARFS
jgi:hypothetical protein